MAVLMWDKPKKVRSKSEWENHAGFDGGPTGGYAPNMSGEDAARWKAKLVGTKTGFPAVEIRKEAGSLLTIVVNLGQGYNYKHYTAVPEDRYRNCGDPREAEYYAMVGQTTQGVNIHMSANGPLQMTFVDFEDMKSAIEEAKAKLEEVTGLQGTWTSYLLKVHPDVSLEAVRDEAVGLGATFYTLYEHRRLVWVSAPETVSPNLVGIKGVVRIETRDNMLARQEIFHEQDDYYNRLGEFE